MVKHTLNLRSLLSTSSFVEITPCISTSSVTSYPTALFLLSRAFTSIFDKLLHSSNALEHILKDFIWFTEDTEMYTGRSKFGHHVSHILGGELRRARSYARSAALPYHVSAGPTTSSARKIFRPRIGVYLGRTSLQRLHSSIFLT